MVGTATAESTHMGVYYSFVQCSVLCDLWLLCSLVMAACLQDRYYGINDPVANKMLRRVGEQPQLEPPEDK